MEKNEAGKRGDGMSTVFLKYHGLGSDYLVYDTGRNDVMLDEKAVRTVCARNCGLGVAGILAGTLLDGRRVEMKLFRPDGSILEAGADEMYIFSRYLKDAGYLEERKLFFHTAEGELMEDTEGLSGEPEAAPVGKLYLSEEFIARNHLTCAAPGIG
ncbi:MAG: hypothetical protein Q4E91_01080 [Lachnospiraceae bacterium]|nr:hypothetical protein [Lachnospiraceae bacterium]